MSCLVEFQPGLFSRQARCYLARGQVRVHHGSLGAALVVLGIALGDQPVGAALVGAGAALIAHDWTDRWWGWHD